MQQVQNAITNPRLENRERTGTEPMLGKRDMITWGMVSPMIIPNAHMPRELQGDKKKGMNTGEGCQLTSECKGELEERHGSTTAGAEAMIHNVNIGMPSA
jgi:hypothetical protein